jgi:hypothetical protein
MRRPARATETARGARPLVMCRRRPRRRRSPRRAGGLRDATANAVTGDCARGHLGGGGQRRSGPSLRAGRRREPGAHVPASSPPDDERRRPNPLAGRRHLAPRSGDDSRDLGDARASKVGASMRTVSPSAHSAVDAVGAVGLQEPGSGWPRPSRAAAASSSTVSARADLAGERFLLACHLGAHERAGRAQDRGPGREPLGSTSGTARSNSTGALAEPRAARTKRDVGRVRRQLPSSETLASAAPRRRARLADRQGARGPAASAVPPPAARLEPNPAELHPGSVLVAEREVAGGGRCTRRGPRVGPQRPRERDTLPCGDGEGGHRAVRPQLPASVAVLAPPRDASTACRRRQARSRPPPAADGPRRHRRSARTNRGTEEQDAAADGDDRADAAERDHQRARAPRRRGRSASCVAPPPPGPPPRPAR